MELILRNGAIENKNAIEISETVYNAFCKESDYHSKEKDKIIINDKFFSDEKKVPDCIRHLNTPFQKMVDKGQWNESSQPADKITSEGNIVLILESPHADEYTASFEPLCPANGRSGVLINDQKYRYLINNDKPMDKIIICNPIQLQTSLVVFHNQSMYSKYCFKKLRNEVWKKIWGNDFKSSEIQKDFIRRLVDYKPSIIINACTSDLKKAIHTILIDRKITNDIHKFVLYKINHPASWNKNTKPMEQDS